MKYIFSIIACLCLMGSIVHAQSGQELIDQQIPQSPEVSDVFKYNPAQNNMFRGNMGLNIPLFNIESDHLTMGSSLSYQSSGIKVNDISSVVGSEWNLNLGGSVSRVVKDQPDDAFAYTTDLRQCMSMLWCRNCEDCPETSENTDCNICREENNEGTYKYIGIDEEEVGYLYNGTKVDSLAQIEYNDMTNEERVFLGGNYFNLLTNVEFDDITDNDIIVDIDAANPQCMEDIIDYLKDYELIDYLSQFISISLGYNAILASNAYYDAVAQGYTGDPEGCAAAPSLCVVASVFLFHNAISQDPLPEDMPWIPIDAVHDMIANDIDITMDCFRFDILRPIYDTKDSEPDQFAFDFNGFQGRFVFDKNGEAKVFSHQDIKIEYTLDPNHVIQPTASNTFNYSSNFVGAITEFKITTPDGVKYYFDAREIGFGNSELQSQTSGEAEGVLECEPPLLNPYRVDMYQESAAYTSWKLTRVEVPSTSDLEEFTEIELEYEETFFINHSNYSQTQQYSCSQADPDSPVESDLSETRSSTVEYVFGQQLKNVKWKRGGSYNGGGKLELNYKDDRLDLHYPSEVEGMMGDLQKVKRLHYLRYYADVNSKSKNVVLNQSYFDQLDVGCSLSQNLSYVGAHRNRLRLDGVKFAGWSVGGGYEQMPPYVFEYNNTPLPPRHSPKQDYWGYYNGNESTSQTLVDKTNIYLINNENNNSNIGKFRTVYSILKRNIVHPTVEEVVDNNQSLGDRTTKLEYAKAGILEKVTFPTGAWNQFEYELNTIGNGAYAMNTEVGGLRVKSITDSKGLVKTYDYTLNGSSSGRISDLPVFASSKRKGDCPSAQTCNGDVLEPLQTIMNNTILHSSPVNQSINGFDVGYKMVTEKIGTAGNAEKYGKTVYEFSFDENLELGKEISPFEWGASSDGCIANNTYQQPGIFNGFCRTYQDNFPFPVLPNMDWKKGLLELKTVYDANEKEVLIENPEYELFCAQKVYGIKSQNNKDVASFYERNVG